MKMLITGISGYYGRVVLPYLLRDDEIESIVGLDVKAPDCVNKKLCFFNGDVRDPGISRHFHGIDTVVHLAFIVTEIKNKKTIFDINVNGTRNVLAAAKIANVKNLVVTSSVSAYGSHPDHPGIITEDTPLRGNKDSYYSYTKLMMERLLDAFEAKNRNINVTRLRPSILCGPNTDNFFLDFIEQKILFYPQGNKEGIPIVHEDDAARALYLAIKKNVSGAFNIASGNLTVEDMSGVLKIPAIGVPFHILKPLADIAYSIGMAPCSSHWLVLGRYPFRLSNEKAKRVLGWEPKYRPVDAFKQMVYNRNNKDE